MTPAARVQAAIEILDQIKAGKPAEQALTGWSRRSRYAGSGDRAAVRDHVFDALRCKRSFAALGGGESGRGLMIGAWRRRDMDPDSVFCGIAHAPAALSPAERAGQRDFISDAERLDIPDWIWSRMQAGLGKQAELAAAALQRRAPVHLRVNLGKATLDEAVDALASEEVACSPHPAARTALDVTGNSRRIRQSQAYRSGLVELQDAASQAVVETLPLRDGMRVLDYCAGGGGKTLAMAAQADIELFAHDAAPNRMRDMPVRAARAGVKLTRLETGQIAGTGKFDLVLCDVPCSGSGAWRRAPEGKWRLTPERLAGLKVTQSGILDLAAGLVRPGGVLAYVTCSLLAEENEHQINAFLQCNPDWRLTFQRNWAVQDGTDGFFSAHLTRTC